MFHSSLFNIVVVVILIIAAGVIGYYTIKKENMEVNTDLPVPETQPADAVAVPLEDNEFASAPPVSETPGQIQPNDLLPNDPQVAAFNAEFPSGQGDVQDKNFLVAGFNIGINTVSSSLKNANLQLRSDPMIRRDVDVGPWNNSTIMASDVANRKTFEIGTN